MPKLKPCCSLPCRASRVALWPRPRRNCSILASTAEGFRHGPEDLFAWFDVVVTILSALSPDRSLAEEVRSLVIEADSLGAHPADGVIVDVLDAINPAGFPNFRGSSYPAR